VNPELIPHQDGQLTLAMNALEKSAATGLLRPDCLPVEVLPSRPAQRDPPRRPPPAALTEPSPTRVTDPLVKLLTLASRRLF
jgi:hypothetical protein